MKNHTPKISVIVPVYNVEQYLPRCIDSILVQTFTDFELLLIDDGSTDNSGKICDEYAKKDNRIRVFHKENGGVSSARNLGLDNIRGEFVNFVDSDDWLEKDCFFILMEDKYIADLTFFGCNLQFTDGSKTTHSPTSFYSSDKNRIEEQLGKLKHNPQSFEYLGYTWNKLFKKEMIDRYRLLFVLNLTFREDELFTLSYSRYITSLRIKSDCIYNYRVTSTGLTCSIKTENEYTLLSNNLLEVIKSYNDLSLLMYEYNAILYYFFRIIVCKKVLTKEWFQSIIRFTNFGKMVKKKYGLLQTKTSLLVRGNLVIVNVLFTVLISILYKYKFKRIF